MTFFQDVFAASARYIASDWEFNQDTKDKTQLTKLSENVKGISFSSLASIVVPAGKF